MSMQTLGEWKVGLDFNPSGDDRVGQAKRLFADLIDHVDAELHSDTRPKAIERSRNRSLHMTEVEKDRLFKEAINELETAAMKVVKALTKKAYQPAEAVTKA